MGGSLAAAMPWHARRSIRTAALAVFLVYARGLPADDATTSPPQQDAESGPAVVSEPAVASEPAALWDDDRQASDIPLFQVSPLEPVAGWTIDYRFRSIASGHTSYEFGTLEEASAGGWAPLSRLRFDLDSTWHGLQIGRQREDWGVHVEYLVPMRRGMDGNLKDYDWMIPGAEFTELGVMRERWLDGHMLDVNGEYLLFENALDLPVDFWATCGFRWQRFNLMCYDLVQEKEYNVWQPDPYRYPGDTIAFKQEYYQYYLGGQLRSSLGLGRLPPVRLMLQGDIAITHGHNNDHHLLREGDRYTLDSTHGDTWHLGLTAEMPVHRRVTIGCQVDYQQTRTKGKHRLLNVPEEHDYTWRNGVRVWSNQTWLTAFARLTW